MNLEQLTDALIEKLNDNKPRALLIGEMNEINHNYNYVNLKPYEAIVIGSITPWQLLQMPSDPVCMGLLEGMPVYYSQKQLWRERHGAKPFRRELIAAEQRLYRMGVLPLGKSEHILTAEEMRHLLLSGKRPLSSSRMTPLARDILEGKEN